ncbi:MAG: DUF4013 domain-containing protein [Bacteroidetes bacterium]|nr:MAG: DUF4013 domain-containing protein [Bacteroidota bacterium]
MTERLRTAFATVFAEEDWFNKVLVGGFYAALVPAGIGMVMVMGFQVEMTRILRAGGTAYPLWRNVRQLFLTGAQAFAVSLWYAFLAVVLMLLLGVPFLSWTTVAVLSALHFLMNPLIVRCFADHGSVVTCMNPLLLLRFVLRNAGNYASSVAVTTALILLAVLFGWMWIVVGWPLIIFLMLIVQTALFARFD